MALFKRRNKTDAPELAAADLAVDEASEQELPGEDGSPGGAAPTMDFDRLDGPFDDTESEAGDLLDLGGLRIAPAAGMQLQIEVDQEQQTLTGVSARIGDSSLQLQAFAAPRSGGLWAEVREEIAAAVVTQGGTAEVTQGPVGTELRTRMRSTGPDGRVVFAPARFLGVDGPRWFLRGVLSGRAAIDEDAAGELIAIYRSIVVVRGSEPMGPRELLPLRLPSTQEPAESSDESDQEASEAANQLNPFERGPEITEVR